MANKRVMEALRALYKKSRNLESWARERDLSFADAYNALVGEGVKVKRGDVYEYERRVVGASVEQIANQYGVTPHNVLTCLRAAGYDAKTKKKTGALVPPPQFVASERLREAWKTLPLERFREMLRYLRHHPDEIANENIGVDECESIVTATGLTQFDVDEIAAVGQIAQNHHGWARSRNQSLIFRQVLEHAIASGGEAYQVFCKPDGWESRPLALHQGGQIVESIGVSPQILYLVPYVREKIDHLTRPKGHAHDVSLMDRSRFVRSAIDDADLKDLTPYIPVRPVAIDYPGETKRWSRFRTGSPVMVTLAEGHIEKLGEIRAALYRQTGKTWTIGDAATTAISQALDEPTAEEEDSEEWRYWCAMSRHERLVDAASELGVEPEEIRTKLKARGWIDYATSAERDPIAVLEWLVEKEGRTLKDAAAEFGLTHQITANLVKKYLTANGIQLSPQDRISNHIERIRATLER